MQVHTHKGKRDDVTGDFGYCQLHHECYCFLVWACCRRRISKLNCVGVGSLELVGHVFKIRNKNNSLHNTLSDFIIDEETAHGEKETAELHS